MISAEQRLNRLTKRVSRLLLKWDESKHPRHPAGSEDGGQFASKDSPEVARQKAKARAIARRSKPKFVEIPRGFAAASRILEMKHYNRIRRLKEEEHERLRNTWSK